MIQHFSFTFFPFFDFATQLFSTPFTSSNLRNQAPLFTELRLLQATEQSALSSPQLYRHSQEHRKWIPIQ